MVSLITNKNVCRAQYGSKIACYLWRTNYKIILLKTQLLNILVNYTLVNAFNNKMFTIIQIIETEYFFIFFCERFIILFFMILTHIKLNVFQVKFD